MPVNHRIGEATWGLVVLPREWFIERVKGREVIHAIERWKAMRAEGWDLHALHERSSGDVIGFGYKPELEDG